MADLTKLLRLRLLQERMTEERLVEARITLDRVEALQQVLENGRQRAVASRLRRLFAGDAESAICHEQTGRQLEASVAALEQRLPSQRAMVVALAMEHTASRQERRRLVVLLKADQLKQRYEEQRVEQRQLDDSYLATQAAKRRVFRPHG